MSIVAEIATGPDLAKGYGEQQLLTLVFIGVLLVWLAGNIVVAALGFVDGGER